MFKNTCILINFVRRTIAFYSKTKFEMRCKVNEVYLSLDPISISKKKNEEIKKIFSISLLR